eukprot:gb/GECG01002467.1/.p1 GENE.gb/GECG01002467.1/~~gb/GECG01002467.1/.p1  ORF type:complete len:114 (+),score=24.56 gb/GECG01002467.1/:1-342(+)
MAKEYASSYENEYEESEDSSTDDEEADVETQSVELRQLIQEHRKTVLATSSRQRVEDLLKDCVDRCEDYTTSDIDELVLLLEEWGERFESNDLTLKDMLDNVTRAPMDLRTDV